MATVIGSELLARALKSQGVDTMFYVMGGPLLETEATAISLGIKAIDTRHEQAAALEAIGQRVAGDVFQDEVGQPVALADIVQRADMRVGHPRDGARFALKALGVARRKGGLGQELERDDAIETRIAGAIDLAHPAGPERGKYFERTNTSARVEPHHVRCIREYVRKRRPARR